jgi:hypothetical protein
MAEVDKEKLQRIAEALVELLMSHPRPEAMTALGYALPVLWCNNTRFSTLTEAIDDWRVFSRLAEKTMAQSFGAIRYGEDDA